MTSLTLDTLVYIGNFCDFTTLVKLRSTCTKLRERLRITTVPGRFQSRLNDSILLTLPHLITLYASDNTAITDASVCRLTNLTTLYANDNRAITDASVKKLPKLTKFYR